MKHLYVIMFSILLMSCNETNHAVVKVDDELSSNIKLLIEKYVENDFDVSIIIKTDGKGNITSTFEIPLPIPDRKLEKTVNLKGQEIKSQTNTPVIEIFDDGTVSVASEVGSNKSE